MLSVDRGAVQVGGVVQCLSGSSGALIGLAVNDMKKGVCPYCRVETPVDGNDRLTLHSDGSNRVCEGTGKTPMLGVRAKEKARCRTCGEYWEVEWDDCGGYLGTHTNRSVPIIERGALYPVCEGSGVQVKELVRVSDVRRGL
jgi:hypothetical protein